MLRKILIFAALGFLFAPAFPVQAQHVEPYEMLTPRLVKEKVLRAAQLVESEGEAAFPKLTDKNGEFVFAGGRGYIWVHSLTGPMLVHPKLVGQDSLSMKDSSGFYHVLAMNKLVKKYGSGWVVYFWAKPGKRMQDFKASFVKLVHHGDGDYVVGCGMYNADKQFIKSVYPNDVIWESQDLKGK